MVAHPQALSAAPKGTRKLTCSALANHRSSHVRRGCAHTCFFTANPAPFPNPANGLADLPLPPGRSDSGLRETSSSFIDVNWVMPWVELAEHPAAEAS